MPSLSGSYTIPKSVLISGCLMMGSGACYMIYQLYTFSKQLKKLNCQVIILTDRLLRAEADIGHFRQDNEQAVGSDDADDEFVDAFDEGESVPLMNGVLPKVSHVEVKSVDDMLKDIDLKTEIGGLKNLTYTLKQLYELLKTNSDNVEILWRIARAAYLLSGDDMLPFEGRQEKHKEFISKAQEAAQKAVNLNPKSGNAHKWTAIVVGSQTQFMSAQEQIKSAFVIKEHTETAIRYKPDDALLHHIMGRWCYSVYMMSWVERRLASALFATPPTATLEDAMKYLEKAETLDPLASIANKLFLAKSFIAKRDYNTAVKHLREGGDLKCLSADDKQSLEEIKKLLQQYESYAS